MKIMKAVIARFYRTQHPLRDIQVPLGNQSKVPALSGCANPRTWSQFSLFLHLFATPGTVMTTASFQVLPPGVLQGLFLLPTLCSSPPDLLSNAPLYLLTFTTSV